MGGISGLVAVEGAILNADELRRELHVGGGDAEVVARLYEVEGDRFPARLRGPFAIAVRDHPRRRLVLARDRFGLVPLAYRTDAAELRYSGDARELSHGELDHDALDAFLALGWVPAPLTLFRSVRALAPGHVLVWEDGAHRVEPYARPVARAPELRNGERAELVEELRARLRDSVRAHLAGAEHVGVLATGPDSALLAALAAEERSAEPLPAFAGKATVLPDALDEPYADPAGAATWSACREAAREGVGVVLSALGADLVRAPDGEPPELFTAEERAALTGRRPEVDPRELVRGRFALSDVAAGATWRAAAAHGVQARMPFLDPVVASIALALPPHGRLGGSALLRDAARPLLGRRARSVRPAPPAIPREVLQRQGLLRPEAVARVTGGERLWALAVLTRWHQRHIEAAAPTELVAESS